MPELQAGERELDGHGVAVGGGVHDLLAAFLGAAAGVDRVQFDGQISCLASGMPDRREVGVDLQQAAGRRVLGRRAASAEGEIVRLLDADVDHVDARARQFVEPRFEGGQRIVRPDRRSPDR